MNAQMERKLIHYGIHPAVVASHMARVTYNAHPQPITPSRRINKATRNLVRVVLGLAAGVALLYITGATP